MNSRRCQILAFVVALGIILTSQTVSTNPLDIPVLSSDPAHLGSEVWSDDFENVTETLSEWIIDGINQTWPEEPYTPNITLNDGMLYSNGPGVNILSHNSTTATGTWSVDVFLGTSLSYVAIYFMSPQWYDYFNTRQGYSVVIDLGYSRFALFYVYPDPAGALATQLASTSSTPSTGWHHIDITRLPDDTICVYREGVLRFHAQNDRLHSSEYFRIWTDNNTIFDNVTVSDTIDIDGLPPRWTEPLIDHTINVGDEFSYALSAYDYFGIDSWWLNDTGRFTVDDEGVVTNVVNLMAGTYGIEVFVNDTWGNILSGSFSVEVQPLPTNTAPTTSTTGPSPLNPLTIALFGVVGAVWFVAVVFIIRDYRFRRNKFQQ